MNRKKIYIVILTCLIAISMFFVGVANSKASTIIDNYSLKNNISSVKLYNNSNTLIYGGNSSSLNTFNAMCIDNSSIHTYLLTDEYYDQVRYYTGSLGSGYYFVLEFKNKLYSNEYSFVFNARYDNGGVGPFSDINIYLNYDDNSYSHEEINRNSGETTFIFDYNYFNNNSKLNKNIKSIRFDVHYVTSIDVFNNNTNLSYDIGYQNGIDSVTNTPNYYNLYSYEQYQYSYNSGYQDGLDTDTSTSYNNGYSTGYTDGYNVGYAYSSSAGVNRVVNFNQLIQNGNFENTYYWQIGGGTTSLNANNNVLEVNTSGSFSFPQIVQNVNTIGDHKYYVSCFAKSSYLNVATFGIGFNGNFVMESRDSNWVHLQGIISSNNDGSTLIIYAYQNTNDIAIFYIKEVNLIDLTQIYGSGNEPISVDVFKNDFPSEFYNYTASTLVNADYQNGYNKGVQDMNVVVREKQELLNKAIDGDLTFTNMFTSIFDVPVQTITGMLNFEFLGVNLLDFFLSIFTICIIIAVLKLIL